MVLGKAGTKPYPTVIDENQTYDMAKRQNLCILKIYPCISYSNQGFTCFEQWLTNVVLLLISRHAFFVLVLTQEGINNATELFAESYFFPFERIMGSVSFIMRRSTSRVHHQIKFQIWPTHVPWKCLRCRGYVCTCLYLFPNYED